MKFLSLKILLISFVFGIFLLFACSNNTTPTVAPESPLPPTLLQATSLDSASISIRWTASPSESNALFAAYKMTFVGDDGSAKQSVTLTKEKNPYTITGLKEGTIYTITVQASYTNGTTSDSIVVLWSPASRFTETANGTAIQVWEYASSYGSGLELYNTTDGGPEVRTTNSMDKWDLGLDTKTSGVVYFGSATQMSFGGGTPALTVISDAYPVNSINDFYDSQALSARTLSEKVVDLNQLSSSVVFIAKTSTNHYAKIFVEKGINGFLQGTAPNRYINCTISYQMKAGVPYARTNKSSGSN